MDRRRLSQRSTRLVSNKTPIDRNGPRASSMWTAFREIALAGWASTARLAVLLLIKQGYVGIIMILLIRR